MGPTGLNPATWIFPATEGCTLSGDNEFLVEELKEALLRAQSGGELPTPPRSKRFRVSHGLFQSKFRNPRLIFHHQHDGETIRFYSGTKNNRASILVVTDTQSHLEPNFFLRVLDLFDGEWGSSSQSTATWDLEALIAGVRTLKQGQAEVIEALDTPNVDT